jgi:Uma2 family endonuclease
MVMATEAKPWTRAELARLPDDGNRYEVLNGELLVTPQANPRHQVIAFALGAILRDHCALHGLGVVVGPGAVVFDDNELQPDVQVIPVRGPIPANAIWEDLPHPLLVVEILSAGSHRHDLVKKRDAYLRVGIPEYWVVDHEARRVLVFRRSDTEPLVFTETLVWQPDTTAALTIDLRELLAG